MDDYVITNFPANPDNFGLGERDIKFCLLSIFVVEDHTGQEGRSYAHYVQGVRAYLNSGSLSDYENTSVTSTGSWICMKVPEVEPVSFMKNLLSAKEISACVLETSAS